MIFDTTLILQNLLNIGFVDASTIDLVIQCSLVLLVYLLMVPIILKIEDYIIDKEIEKEEREHQEELARRIQAGELIQW